MSSRDKTKDLLEQMLAGLYQEQAQESQVQNGSYLVAQDGQLLGKINNNLYDTDSIVNQYGPYGSRYSATSIFNAYSQYGSQYGQNSINNPYCSNPPKLYINGQLKGYVTSNPYIANRITPEAFLYTMHNDFNSLINGQIIESESHARKFSKESFIEAQNGTFLGKLTSNTFDQESIFNKFGQYGNKFSQISIFNRFSEYGNQFSQLSPYNKFTQTPPRVYVEGEFVAYLTVNTFLNPHVHPDDIIEWVTRNVRR